MNNIKTIAKYTLKEAFFPYLPKKTIANYPKNYIGRLVLILYSYVFFGAFFYFYQKATGSIFLNSPDGGPTYFAMFGVALSLMILFFYTPKIISDFFSDKNSKIYKTLPITEGELFIGKLFGTIFSSLDFLLFLLISLIVYFSYLGFDLGVLIFGIINFISLIIIPYTIIAGLILVVMKYTNAASHRKLLKNIGYVFIFLIIGFFYYMSFVGGKSAGSGTGGDAIDQAVSTVSSVADWFLNAKFFGLAVGGSLVEKIGYTLLLLAISAILLYLVYKFANKYYYESITEKDLVGEAKKKTKQKKSVGLKQSSPIKTIAKRDFKNLFSNIVFLSSPIVMMIIFGFMIFSIGGELSSELEINNISIAGIWIFLVGFGFGLLIWSNSGFTSESLSREHSSFYLFQTLPIRPTDHYLGRLASSMIASSIFNLVLTIIISFGLKLVVLNAIILFLGMSLGTGLGNITGLYLGTKAINTSWKKPEELSKGGGRQLLYYFLSMIFVGIIGVGYALLIGLTQIPNILALLLLLIIIFAVMYLFAKLGIKAYKKGFYDVA